MCLDKTAGISFVVGMVLIVIIGMDSAGFFQFLCGNDVYSDSFFRGSTEPRRTSEVIAER